MIRHDINWYEALEAAEYYADLKPNVTAHWTEAGLRNLAHAYLELLSDAAWLRMALDEAKGVAP